MLEQPNHRSEIRLGSFHAKCVTQTGNIVSFEENILPLTATEEITSYTVSYSFSHITVKGFIQNYSSSFTHPIHISTSNCNEMISKHWHSTHFSWQQLADNSTHRGRLGQGFTGIRMKSFVSISYRSSVKLVNSHSYALSNFTCFTRTEMAQVPSCFVVNTTYLLDREHKKATTAPPRHSLCGKRGSAWGAGRSTAAESSGSVCTGTWNRAAGISQLQDWSVHL